jgi:hypothetical protein
MPFSEIRWFVMIFTRFGMQMNVTDWINKGTNLKTAQNPRDGFDGCRFPAWRT